MSVHFAGWAGAAGHERERPYDPATTHALNNEIWEQEEKTRKAKEAREAKARANGSSRDANS